MTDDHEVYRLDPNSTGRWLIHTNKTVHVVDLDARTYERRPGPESKPFPGDNSPMSFTRIDLWPCIGQRMMIWFDDPRAPELFEYFHLTSSVRKISRDEAATAGGTAETR